MESDDEFIGNRHMQNMLYEAASDLARRGELGRYGFSGGLPCRSTSEHIRNFDDRDFPEAETGDASYAPRRSFSSPAIPEFGRHYFRVNPSSLPKDISPATHDHLIYLMDSTLATEEDSKLAHYRAHYQQQKQGMQQQHMECPLDRYSVFPDDYMFAVSPGGGYPPQERSGRPQVPRAARRPTYTDYDVGVGHHDLSSEGSYEQINLDDVSIEGNYCDNHPPVPPRQEFGAEEKGEREELGGVVLGGGGGGVPLSSARNQPLTPPGVRAWRNHQEANMASDDEDSYLEESPLCSRRPIIRLLEEEGDAVDAVSRPYNPYRDVGLSPYSVLDREGIIDAAEKHIAYLNQTVYKVKMENNELMELHKFRSREWMDLKDRLRAEIIELREQNTTLMCDRMNKGGRLNKRIAATLLRAKKESDRALATTLERQQKINELRLLVTMQQRYILTLEDSMGELQRAFHVNGGLEEARLSHMQEGKLTELPMRHPAETQVLSGYQDVLGCDRSNYLPGITTDPELATAEVFDFAGETRILSEKRDLESFDMLKVPYVRGALASTE